MRAAALLLAAAVLVSGCSTDSKPSTSRTTVVPVVGNSLSAAVTTTWHTASDTASGVMFQLPGPSRPHTSRADGVTSRSYVYAFSQLAELSVAVSDLPSAAKARSWADGYAATLTAQFTKGGAKDFRVVSRQRTTYRGHDALDLRVSFTPLAGSRVPPAWFLRLVVDGVHVVVLQTVAFPPSAGTNYLDSCRKLQARLVGTLRL